MIGPNTFQFPFAHKETYRELPILGEDSFGLEYTWRCKSFIGTFAEDSGLSDAEEYQFPPAGGTVLEWGDPWQEAEIRVIFWGEYVKVFF